MEFKWRNISISSWLYRIATNEINNYFRRKKYKPDSLNRLIDNYNFNIADDKETEKEKLEKELTAYTEFLKVQKALKEIDVKYQEVISLRFFEKKSIKEISEILDKKEDTIKSLLSRGLEKIRNKI